MSVKLFLLRDNLYNVLSPTIGACIGDFRPDFIIKATKGQRRKPANTESAGLSSFEFWTLIFVLLLRLAKVVVALVLARFWVLEVAKHQDQAHVVLTDHLPVLPKRVLGGRLAGYDCTLVQTRVDVRRVYVVLERHIVYNPSVDFEWIKELGFWLCMQAAVEE